MWTDEQVFAGRAAVAHVNECPARAVDAPCEECRSAIESVSRLIPKYDPWADPDGATFDYLRARTILGFYFDHLVFIEGEKADQPFVLEPWQAAVVVNVFGWIRPSGFRRYREFLLWVAAKNGKSPLLAGMALFLLLCDGEPGAQVYFAAADKDQASLLFRWAAGMVFKNPDFGGNAGDLCQVHKAWKSIQVDATMSVLRTLSSDADTKHGLNAHGVFVDELHAHHDRTLFDVLKTRTSSRRQPLVGVITTADYERPSICNEVYHYACKVRDGTISAPSYLPVIYEADAKDDIQSPATWRKANPNLGVSVREDALREESARATHSPGYRDEFLRTNLNVRTNAKESAIDSARWALCVSGGEPGSLRSMRFDALRVALRGRRCFGGLDLSSTRDLASFALFFPEVSAALWWSWIPRDSAKERELRDRVPYLQWAREGALVLTGSGPDERTVDYAAIRTDIARLATEYDLQDLAFDRWGANETLTALRDAHGIRVLSFGQGFGPQMVAATKEFDRLTSAAILAHGSDPVATWAVSNLVWAVDDAGNWKPSKRKSTERIDPAAAVIMAIGASLLAPPPPPTPSVSLVEMTRPSRGNPEDDMSAWTE